MPFSQFTKKSGLSVEITSDYFFAKLKLFQGTNTSFVGGMASHLKNKQVFCLRITTSMNVSGSIKATL